MLCPNCKTDNLVESQIKTSGAVRGESFAVTATGLACKDCGFQTLEGEQFDEYRVKLADAYRKKHGLLTTGEIIQYRENLNMTQDQFAEYLRIGIASVKRWELGKIQDQSSDELIRLKCDETFAEKNALNVCWQSHPADIYSGNIKFSLKRLQHVVLKCVGAIKGISLLFLNKMLFYVDFFHFREYRASITGTRYVPLEYGPCPDQYKELFRMLVEKKVIEFYKGNNIRPIAKFNPDLFDKDELKTINYVVGLFKKDMQKYYKLSHKEDAHLKTAPFQHISYEHASTLKL